jgi:hypothetical protein
VANYTRALVDMAQVIQAGKPIYEITTPPEQLKVITDRVSKLVEIHRVMTEMTPDPEAQSETSVSLRSECRLVSDRSSTITNPVPSRKCRKWSPRSIS